MDERSIFFEALDRDDPAERSAYLDHVCAADPALRRRVEALLRSHARPGDFLNMPAPQQLAAKTVTRRDDDPDAGEAPSDEPIANIPLDFLAPARRPDSLGRLGHYEVLKVIGQGGMGVVVRALDEKLHRVVAIKALVPAMASSGSALRRFAREARAAAAVAHDNVIAIHAVEEEGPVPYLVMQYIDGPTLQEKLDRGGALSVREVLRIGIQVAAGLAAVHAQGLVHRDVKPANILLENGIERVKITDFGLARTVDDASLSQSGLIAGTPAYMSPEQANGEPVDHRSDLFSLGGVLYSLCTGCAPFRAGISEAILKRVCDEAPRPIREINAGVPEWLVAIISRLHAKPVAGRYQTATEVADLLSRHLASLQQSDAMVLVPEAGGRQAGRERAPQIATIIAILLGTAILGAGIASRQASRRGGAAPVSGRPAPTVQQAPAWQLRPPSTPDELAKLASPLDALKREEMAVPNDAPPEVVALLRGERFFQLSTRASSHWMAQTADGRLLAVPSNGDVDLFDAETGALLRTLTGPGSRAYGPAFSPDGARLAAGCEDGRVTVWDAATGQELLSLVGHTAPAWTVAFDPEGKRLISADSGAAIKVWDARGQVIHEFVGHDGGGVHKLAFSPDGKRLATASSTCKIWDSDDWHEIRSLTTPFGSFQALTWSRDGKLLAAGDDTGVVFWNADTYEVLHTLETPAKGLLALTSDGRTLLTARHDNSAKTAHAFTRWDVATGRALATFPLPTDPGLACLNLGVDDRLVFVVLAVPPGSTVRAFDVETGLERYPLHSHRGPVGTVAVSPDGRTLASGGVDHAVRLWDLARWRPGEPLPPARTLEGHTHEVWSVAFSPDGSLLASGGADGLLFLWDAASGRNVHDLNGYSPSNSRVAFSPDGRTVGAGGPDGTVNRWDAATGQPHEPWRWHVGAVRSVAFSPDGRWLASGGTDATVQLLDAVTGQRRQALRGGAHVTTLAFSPDGRTLAAASDTQVTALRLWDLETKALRALAGHTEPILGLAFHPSGSRVATASLDGTVRLWDVTPTAEGARTLDFRAIGEPRCVAFGPEGRHLVVGLANGMIAIARVTP